MGDWSTLILLGIAASFMPLVSGLEITILGGEKGAKKSSSLVGGVTLFRVLIAIGVTLFLTAGIVVASHEISNVADNLGSTVSQFRQGVTTGQYIILDVLLVAAGILLIVNAISHIRGRSNGDLPSDDGSTESQDSKAIETGVAGMIGIGLIMSATNVNQWVFMTAGVSQILDMLVSAPERLFAFVLFLVVSSVMILLPLIVILIRPQQAQRILGNINRWIHGALKYAVAGVLLLIGLYLIARGAAGITHYYNV